MIINYGGSGTYSEDGNGGYIWRRNTQDGHGGHSAEHRAEMEQIAERIAQQKIMEMIPEIQKAAYISAYSDDFHIAVSALEFLLQQLEIQRNVIALSAAEQNFVIIHRE